MNKSLLLFALIFSFVGRCQQPEVVITMGHTDWISSLDVSEDGEWLATGSMDKTAKLIHIPTNQELRTFPNFDGRVSYVKISPDVKHMAVMTNAGELAVFEVKTGKPVGKKIKSGTQGFQFDFFSNEEIYCLNQDGMMSRLKFKTGEITPFSQEYGVSRTCLSADKKFAYGWTYQGRLLKVDANSGELKSETTLFKELKFPVCEMEVSDDGKYLFVAFDDNLIYVLSTADLSLKTKLKGHTNRIKYLKSNETKNELMACDYSNDVIFWDLKSFKEKKRFKPGIFGANCLESHPKEDIYLIAESRMVHIYDRKTHKEIKTYEPKANKIVNMAYDQNGKYLVSSTVDVKLKLWDLEKNKILNEIYAFWPVQMHPNGRQLFANTVQQKIGLHDLKTMKALKYYDSQGDLIQNITVSPNQKYLAGIGLQGKVWIWDIESTDLVKKIDWVPGMTYGLQFSPDGKYVLASGLENNIYVWETATGALQTKIGNEMLMFSDFRFSPDGSKLITVNWDKKVRIYNTSNWELSKEFEAHVNTILCMDISKDGKYFATGSGNNSVSEADNSVKVWETETGNLVCHFTAHTGNINRIQFDNDGEHIFSCGNDGTIKYWDFRICEEVASYVSVGKDDFLITTPDNYYFASRGALDAVAFRVDGALYPFEQFDLKLNRPDIVSERIGKTSPELVRAYAYVYKKRLRKMNFSEDQLASDFELPKLVWDRTQVPFKTSEKVLKTKVHLSDDKHKLNRLNVYVNGVPVYGYQGISLEGNELDKDLEIPLIPGKNSIEISVLNDAGAESLRESAEILNEQSASKSNLYLISLGVSEYEDERFNLKYAAKDAKDVATSFESKSDDFNEIYEISYTDAEVLKGKWDELLNLVKKANPEDVVVVFVAGHGVLNQDFDYYFAAHNTDFNAPEENGIPYEMLDELLANSGALKKLLIMDTCHSGEVDKEELEADNSDVVVAENVSFRNAGAGVRKKEAFGMENSVEFMQSVFSDVRRGSGATVISSAGAAEFAMESSEWSNGLFTFCLLEGLQKGRADANRDGDITVSELRHYVYERVSELSQGKQKPTTREENIQMNFVVW